MNTDSIPSDESSMRRKNRSYGKLGLAASICFVAEAILLSFMYCGKLTIDNNNW
jgi:hypothetical protein